MKAKTVKKKKTKSLVCWANDWEYCFNRIKRHLYNSDAFINGITLYRTLGDRGNKKMGVRKIKITIEEL